MKALVVDDEKLIVKGIKFSLLQDGYEVDCAYDGKEALEYARNNTYDVILLDVMLPELDGFEVCQAVREFSDVPIIMLTAKGDDMDKILGFDIGVDDYITKPFNILEVKARIKAIIRRQSKNQNASRLPKDNHIISGELDLDKEARLLKIGGKEYNLTAKEYEILELLVSHPGKVYSREELYRIIWNAPNPQAGDLRTVDVHVRRLREKIEPSPSEPRYVQTKWGIGYYFRA